MLTEMWVLGTLTFWKPDRGRGADKETEWLWPTKWEGVCITQESAEKQNSLYPIVCVCVCVCVLKNPNSDTIKKNH